MIIGIVGSRRRTRHQDYVALYNKFSELYARFKIGTPLAIVSGDCPVGGDAWAKDIAEDFQIIMLPPHEAKWKEYGRSAGLIRNTDVAKEAQILLALVAEDRTGGTEDTIRKFKKFHPDGELILI